MRDDLPNSDVAGQLHDDLFVTWFTDSDNVGFANDLEKGPSVNELPKTPLEGFFYRLVSWQEKNRTLAVSEDTPMAHDASIPAWKKAGNTDRWTEILFRALTSRVADRWRFASFRGIGGREWRGVVDVLAVRKDTSRSVHEVLKSGDLFEFILVQMKGGSAPMPTTSDIKRLKAVGKRYRVKAIILFTWQKGKGCEFLVLGPGGKWIPSTSAKIFD